MGAYEIFLVQTQPIVNYLFIPVIFTLPLLWFGDCKRTMSLLFKRINLPEAFDIVKDNVELTNNFQILVPITLAVFSYLLHKYWRLYIIELRCESIYQEIKFTETIELNEQKIKLLQTINNIIEKGTKGTGKYTNNINVERMINSSEIPMSLATIPLKINSNFEELE